MPDEIRLFTVLAFFDRYEASVPVTGKNLLAALKGHRSMRSGAVALVSRYVQADRVVDVIFDGVLLPRTDRLPVYLSLVGFGPEVPRVPRMPA